MQPPSQCHGQPEDENQWLRDQKHLDVQQEGADQRGEGVDEHLAVEEGLLDRRPTGSSEDERSQHHDEDEQAHQADHDIAP